MNAKKCDICGALFVPHTSRQHRCLSCVADNSRKCSVCGAIYISQNPRRRYCDKCLLERRRHAKDDALAPWSDSRREALKRKCLKNHDDYMKRIEKANEICKTHPATSAGSENHHTRKIWNLRDPNGVPHKVENLHGFIVRHPEYFDKPESAYSQFKRIARTIRSPESVSSPLYSCQGWTLDDEPQYSPEYKRAVEKQKKLNEIRAKRKSSE